MNCNGTKSDTTAEIRRRVVADVLAAREHREKAEEVFAEASIRLSRATAAYEAAMKTATDLIGPTMKHDEILVSPVDPRFGVAKRVDNSLRVVPLVGVRDLDKPARAFAVPTSRADDNPTLALRPIGFAEGGVPVFLNVPPYRGCGSKLVVDMG